MKAFSTTPLPRAHNLNNGGLGAENNYKSLIEERFELTPEDAPARKLSSLDFNAYLNVEAAFKGLLEERARKNHEYLAAHTNAPLFSVMV